MRLDTYISDLLYRYECVAVPGLGAFLTQRQGAMIDEEAQVFFPPKKTLSFNRQLTSNDGLLANYIAKTEGVSFEESVKKIASYVRFVKAQLDENQSFAFENIGVLSQDEAGRLSFEPETSVNYLTESFGLAAYPVKPVMREVYKEQTEALEKKAPIALSAKKRSTPWLKYAAIGLIAIGLSGGLGYGYIKNIENHNFAEKQKAETQLENQIQHATFMFDNPLPAVTVEAFKPEGKYHIVAGAFRIEENAALRVEQLREKGYKARQIGKNRYGLHQVVYGSYGDGQEALKALREVRKTDNKSAWMLVEVLE